MKKVISLLLVCMMMLSMVTVVSALTTHTTGRYVTVTLGEQTYDATSATTTTNIDIPIKLDKLPEHVGTDISSGIAGASVVVTFDNTRLKLTNVLAGMKLMYYDEDEGAEIETPTSWIKPIYNDANQTGMFTAAIMGLDQSFTTVSHEKNDVLVKLRFQKLDNAVGTATVTLNSLKLATNSGDDANDHEYTEGYFNLDNANCTVILSQATQYDVTAPSSEAGKYTVAGIESGKVNENTALNFTVTPEVGYEVVVKAGDTPLVGTNNAYTYTVTGDTAISVTASKTKYALTKAATENGSFTLSPAEGQVAWGETVTVTAAPDTGYRVKAIKVNGTPIQGTTFVMDKAAAEVAVEFELIPPTEYTVSTGACENGSVSAVPTSATAGTTITVTAAPADGYELDKVLVNGVEKDLTFEMPAANVTVTATFKKVKYALTKGAENAEQGTFTILPVAGQVEWGTNVIVTATPATGYQVKAIKVNGVEKTATFEMPKDNAEVTVEFEKKTYVLDVATNEDINVTGLTSNGLSGTIEFATENVKAGENFEFTVTAPAGYYVGSVDAKNEAGESVLAPVALMGATETKTATMPMDGKIKFEATYLSNDSAIKALTVNGKAVAINDATKTGEVALDVYATTATVVVEVADGATAVIDGADMSGNVALTSDPQTITITVTSEAGENEIYAILVDNAVNPMMDTGISSITVNGKAATINGTDATVTLDVYAMTADINVVTVEEDATVTIGGVDGKTVVADIYSGAGDYIFNIVVTAKDGVTEETYTLTVTNPAKPANRPASSGVGTSNSTLADIKEDLTADIDKAVEDLNKDDYSEEAWAEIEKLIEDAKADLENAKNTTAAKKVKEELLEAIDAVKTLEEEAEDKIPVDETIEPAVIAAPEKTETELAAAEALYSDMEGHWSLAYVHELSVVNNVFKGNEDGTFAPDKGITRQEIAVALGRLLGLEEIAAEVTATDFTDDAEIADWAKGYVAVMNELGLLKGYADGSFGSNDVITREQLALILSRMVEAPAAVAGMAFDDADGISDWAAEGCSVAYTLGIIKGYPDNTFKGSNTVTRAEAVVMIYNYLAAIAE